MPTGVPSVAPVESLIHLFGVMFGIVLVSSTTIWSYWAAVIAPVLVSATFTPTISLAHDGTVIAVRAVLVTVSSLRVCLVSVFDWDNIGESLEPICRRHDRISVKQLDHV